MIAIAKLKRFDFDLEKTCDSKNRISSKKI